MTAFYFGAAWCGQCKVWKPTFEQKCKDAGIDYEMVDAEDDEDLCTRYGIRNIPYVVVLDDQDDIVLSGIAADVIPLI